MTRSGRGAVTDQLDFFSAPAPSGRARAVGPAAASEHTRALAERVPAGLYLGTSSWSFPGWEGIVWDRAASERTLARDGLAAYAEHPLLRGVGLDRTHYAPLPASELCAYRDSVPEAFRFLVKAHEELTLSAFPKHPRYGQRRGDVNPRFLDVEYATNEVVGPTVEGLGDKLFALLFQLAPQDPSALGGPEGFAERLHAFLDGLPKGVPYAVEVRNEELLTDAYAQALVEVGASHCLTSIRGMPAPMRQAHLVKQAVGPRLVVRWLLHPRYDYREAYRRYHPFRGLVDTDEEARGQIAALVLRALETGREAMVIANNKAEGCAPLSLMALAERLAKD